MDVRAAFTVLDKELGKRGQTYLLIIAGGAVFQLKNTDKNRTTDDIDSMVSLDESFMDILSYIFIHRDKLNLDISRHDWINSAVISDGDELAKLNLDKALPVGWRGRALASPSVYSSVNLKVYSLAESDLKLSKLFALLSRYHTDARGRDIDDLKDLSISRKDIDQSLHWLTDTLKIHGHKSTESEVRYILLMLIFGESGGYEHDV